VSELRFTVPVGAGELAGVLHLSDDDLRGPCVIACHGLGASKDAHRREAVAESRRWLLAHLPHAAPASRPASTGRIR